MGCLVVGLSRRPEQVIDDVRGAVALPAGTDQVCQKGEVLPDGCERGLDGAAPVALPEPDSCNETIAHTPAALGVLEAAPLADIGRGRLGRTAVPDFAVVLQVRDAEVAGFANPTALLVDIFFARQSLRGRRP